MTAKIISFPRKPADKPAEFADFLAKERAAQLVRERPDAPRLFDVMPGVAAVASLFDGTD
jgi:hypothetical protein